MAGSRDSRGGGGGGGSGYYNGGRSGGGGYYNDRGDRRDNGGGSGYGSGQKRGGEHQGGGGGSRSRSSRYRGSKTDHNRDRDTSSGGNNNQSSRTRGEPYTTAEDLELFTMFKGSHSKQITGIAMDPNSNRVFTSSKDGKVCVWDAATCTCTSEVPMGAEIDSMLVFSGFLFVGINVREGCCVIRAIHLDSSAHQDLEGHTGEIYALTTNERLLFSASRDKTIRVWQFDETSNVFGCVSVLREHTGSVLALAISGDILFSAGMDTAIKVWSLSTGMLVQSIESAHREAILSLAVWEGHLLSGGLDGEVKVWEQGGANSGTTLAPKCKFSFPIENSQQSGGSSRSRNRSYHRNSNRSDNRRYRDGAMAICCTTDMNIAAPTPILMVSYGNGSIGLWELPSFGDRGEVKFPREMACTPIRSLASQQSHGVMFTGDSKGQVCVWRWRQGPVAAS